jgi:hypothetical protein
MILTERVSGRCCWSGTLAALALALVALPGWSLGQAPPALQPAAKEADVPDDAFSAAKRQVLARWLDDASNADRAATAITADAILATSQFDEAVARLLVLRSAEDAAPENGKSDAPAEVAQEHGGATLTRELARAEAKAKAAKAQLEQLRARGDEALELLERALAESQLARRQLARDKRREREHAVVTYSDLEAIFNEVQERSVEETPITQEELRAIEDRLAEALARIGQLQSNLDQSRAEVLDRAADSQDPEQGLDLERRPKVDAAKEAPRDSGADVEVPDGGTVLLGNTRRDLESGQVETLRGERMEKLLRASIQDSAALAQAIARRAHEEMQHARALFDKGYLSQAQYQAAAHRFEEAQTRLERLESLLK